MDSHRLLTGDVEGYVYAWDLPNCLDQNCGPQDLCLRAHNAMDPDVYCKVQKIIKCLWRVDILGIQDTEKNVYSVHLETAAMIQVAGGTGRIVISDFWDYDAFDSFQLESFAPKLGS